MRVEWLILCTQHRCADCSYADPLAVHHVGPSADDIIDRLRTHFSGITVNRREVSQSSWETVQVVS